MNFDTVKRADPVIRIGAEPNRPSRSAFLETLSGDSKCVSGVVGVRQAGGKLVRTDITGITTKTLYFVLEGTEGTQNSVIQELDRYPVKTAQLAPGCMIETPIFVDTAATANLAVCVRRTATDPAIPVGTLVYTDSSSVDYETLPNVLIDYVSVSNVTDDGYGYVAFVCI